MQFALGEGIEILSACDGIEAVQLIQADDQIDLILSDVCMPGMCGDELHKCVQGELTQRNGLFVAMTGDCSTEQALYFKRCGVTLLRKGEFGATELRRYYHRFS